MIGYAALLATIVKIPGADLAAYLTLGLVGAAVITTLQDEVKSQGLEWGWEGAVQAMKRPSKDFLIRMAVHLPQLITAVAIALNWRRKRK